MEVKGFKLSRSKTEYLHCHFSVGEGGVENEVAMGVRLYKGLKGSDIWDRSFKEMGRLMRTLTNE